MVQYPTMTQYGLVLVTASSQAEAAAIAKTLIQERLAACVSITPVHSIYTWENQVVQEQEWQLLIKTNLEQFAILEARVQELHSYQVPEIIAIPIVAGSQPYLEWIGKMASPNQS